MKKVYPIINSLSAEGGFFMPMFARQSAVCFTGHRNIPLELRPLVIEKTDRAVRYLASAGFSTFISGGAVGFDLLAACRVLVAKRRDPSIKLVMALPCHDQTAAWRNLDDLKLYKVVLGQADEVFYTSDMYAPGCMRIRNQWMVDHAAVCVAYKTRDSGGTAMTVRMAQNSGLGFLNVADEPFLGRINLP